MNRIIYLIGLILLITSCSSSRQIIYPRTKKTTKTRRVTKPRTRTSSNPTLADKIIWTAVSYKGTPYKYGGTTKSGIDCSGLVMVSFADRGVTLPRTSAAMSQTGYNISLKQAKRGDLVFFTTNPRKPTTISHVGLVTSVQNGVVHFIHASTKRGVTVNNMSESYYKRNFAKAKRVL